MPVVVVGHEPSALEDATAAVVMGSYLVDLRLQAQRQPVCGNIAVFVPAENLLRTDLDTFEEGDDAVGDVVVQLGDVFRAYLLVDDLDNLFL